MVLNNNRWKPLFLFCLGLAMASAFCMKWMEQDFIVGTEKFSIMGLELFYPLEKVETILKGLDARVSTILRYHLYFDFVFMAGIFPGIAALCRMARKRAGTKTLKNILASLAILQLLAWALDITENCYLLGWLKDPDIDANDLMLFHIIVAIKWVIALLGTFTAIPFFLIKRKLTSV
jgi:hypothetical protein